MSKYSLPDSLTIKDKSYPVRFLSSQTTPHAHGYLFVDEKPIISIEFLYGKPLPDSLKRAEFAIKSYEQLKGIASLIPQSLYSCWSDEYYSEVSPDEHYESQLTKRFSLIDVDLSSTNVEPFAQFNVPHLCVTCNANTDAETTFCIWDRELIVSIVEAHNRKISSRGRGYRITCDTPDFSEVLQGITH